MATRECQDLECADLTLIKRMIPHRYPFLMIDKVICMVRGKSAVGIKNVTVNEPYFQGHFPDEPVVPGVTIIESMAQTAAVLVNHTLDMVDQDISIYLLGVDKARFRRKVVPGDVLELHISVLRGGGKVWKLKGEGRVGDSIAAQAEITAIWELNAGTG
ncbi:MAG: 3-hydroxyacyl-ACP dehydratase FabZ [Rhodobacteraceae bacterium]|nr:3-hydroxyacyl-ACP dehydratase FabZ [Paracoccaceae bacterium]